MSQPKISIVIPCYKVEKYLDQCIKSVITQTLTELEVILVDDESPDYVPEMCDDWALKDNRIKVIHKKNAGLGMACNSGLEIATGKYVAFLDSDDWVDENMYLSMYNVAEKYQAQMVFTGLRRVGMKGEKIGLLTHKTQLQIYKGKEKINSLARDMIASDLSIDAERTLQMSAKVVLYSRETIERNFIRFVSEREILSEDLHFNLNAFSHSECVCVMPDFFYNYRCNTDSITGKLDLSKFPKMKMLYQFTQDECVKLEIGGNVQQRVQRMFIGYVRNYIRTISRSKLSIAQQHEIIHGIVEDSIWNPIWATFPIKVMPLRFQLYIKLFQYHWVAPLRLLLKYK